ncbi:hypothetical protein [Alistipes sp.]|uniref:hypothetical protein n=1 Tax=Alistipes sp. TaxID=1872444 RepID=UPI003AEF4E18
MKKLLLVLCGMMLIPVLTCAQEYVKGYYRKDGTYVQGHYRSKKNDTNHDNYATKQNKNPYTGKKGTIPKDYSYEAYLRNSNKIIYIGPKGGQYYINSKGKKVYVPKTKKKRESQ